MHSTWNDSDLQGKQNGLLKDNLNVIIKEISLIVIVSMELDYNTPNLGGGVLEHTTEWNAVLEY